MAFHIFREAFISSTCSGVRRGVGGGFKPPKQEKIVVKNDVISEISIFSNNISQK